MFDRLLTRIGHMIAHLLEKEIGGYEPYAAADPQTLRASLRPGDVLLVEGNQRISSIIKYLTQSTWSHAAVFVGDALPKPADGSERPRLIEVLAEEGCIASPLSKYERFNTRICRPVGLTPQDRRRVVQYMVDSLGKTYDLKNIIDLLRYLVPLPFPARIRRRMLALGSGDPTRAICSSLIAQAFQEVRYPILPHIERGRGRGAQLSEYTRREILHIRHHSLFAPRDFDVSPYFRVIKPTIEGGFDYKALVWSEQEEDAAA